MNPRAVLIAATAVGLIALVIIGCGPTGPETPKCVGDCTLVSLAGPRGIRVGAAVTANGLADPAYAAAVTRNFNSITPEFDMKWRAVHPTRATWNWDAAETVVSFAAAHQLAIRGHTLVWGKASANPPWLMAQTDPAEFRASTIDAISTEVAHFAGRVDRWDVVNEPFLPDNAGLDHNVFYDRIGPDYVDLAFRTARAADPNAKLWLNEASLERGHSRADAFIGFVASMVSRGVPIDGVGIQTHLISGQPLEPGVLGSVVSRIRALGLSVAITEMDVPTGPTNSAQAQADTYGRAARECLLAGCEEITTWGVSDNTTWLDLPSTRADLPVLDAFPIPCKPLLLDNAYLPKAAYLAVADALHAIPAIR